MLLNGSKSEEIAKQSIYMTRVFHNLHNEVEIEECNNMKKERKL